MTSAQLEQDAAALDGRAARYDQLASDAVHDCMYVVARTYYELAASSRGEAGRLRAQAETMRMQEQGVFG